MNYLESSEYLEYGLEATTDPSWVTAASAIIDAHCRRATLGVNHYQERLKMPPDLNTVRLSYLPLVTVAPGTSPTRGVAASGVEPGVCDGVCATGIVDGD